MGCRRMPAGDAFQEEWPPGAAVLIRGKLQTPDYAHSLDCGDHRYAVIDY